MTDKVCDAIKIEHVIDKEAAEEYTDMNVVKRMTLSFLGLVGIYLTLMILVYSIPNAWIAGNVSAAQDVIKTEGPFAQHFFGYPFGQVDNNTDNEMYLNLLKADGNSTLKAAMVPRYARYWQGYAVILRPLSIFLNIINIRYLNMIVLMVLLCLCFNAIARRVNLPTAIVFLLGLLASFILLAPFNIQFFIVSTLSLIFSLVVLKGYPYHRFQETLPTLFLAFGSLTNFFDFLTFPIMALGYPLILLLVLRRQDGSLKQRTFGTEIFCLLLCSASWCVGYGMTLFAKGVLGSLFTGANVLRDIYENMVYRIGGALPEGFKQPLTVWTALAYNINTFFNLRTLSMFIVSVAVLGGASVRWHKPWKEWPASLPLLGVSLFPYVWYSVLANHSNVHFFFTNKAQAVTFFGVCVFFITVIDFAKIRLRKNRPERIK